jgi:hypothetical protein
MSMKDMRRRPFEVGRVMMMVRNNQVFLEIALHMGRELRETIPVSCVSKIWSSVHFSSCAAACFLEITEMGARKEPETTYKGSLGSRIAYAEPTLTLYSGAMTSVQRSCIFIDKPIATRPIRVWSESRSRM